MSFTAYVGLLNSTAFPNSLGTALWADNASPSTGTADATCVAEQVLAAFNIPFTSSLPYNRLCALPGYDLNNVDAIQALKLSLASYLKNGQLWDIFSDGYGVAEFVQIYPAQKTVVLNVRMCLPNTMYDDNVHTVVVRGYDAPPVRHIREGEVIIPSAKTEGDLNPQQVAALSCCLISEASLYGTIVNEVSCAGRPYHRSAVISYKDPILQAQYKDGQQSVYEPRDFESIEGYIIKFDTGMSPDLNVTYQQSATTSVTYTLPFTGLLSTGTHCAILQTSAAFAQFGYQRFVIGTVETQDRYGDTWPIFIGVSNLKVVGNTIQEAYDSRAGGGGVSLFIDERITHTSPPANKNWHWTYESGVPVLYVYSPKYDDGSTQDYIWELLSTTLAPTIYPYRAANTLAVNKASYSLSSGPITRAGVAWPNLGSGIGTLVQKMAVTVDIDRPSIVVSDPRGRALDYARALEITYYPLVVEDTPAPVGYNVGGTAGIVDHTLDIYDTDPTTVQPNPQTVAGSMTWLESQKTGATIDISLPFLETGDECRDTANFLYNLYDNFGEKAITSYSLTCGPDDRPELGALVNGFNSNLRINEISYNYQDGNSYTISVTLGPIFQSLGSWNTSAWQRKTETVSRQGIITYTAGDGVTYRVRVQGLGEYYALNTTATTTFFVGEKVNVQLRNNPVES